MELRTLISAGLVTSVLCLGGCAGDASPAAQTTEPSPTQASPTASPTATPAAAAATPLDGSWMTHLTRAEYAERLDSAGLGRWTDAFLKGEDVLEGENPAVYRFGAGVFSVGYYDPGQPWHVGWKGTYEVSGQEVSLSDDFSAITDTFRWRVQGDRLRLTWLESDVEELDGIPLEVYHVAYLGGWLDRTECAMVAEDDCLS